MSKFFFLVIMMSILISCGGEQSSNYSSEQRILSGYVVQNISNYDVYINYELLNPSSEQHPEVIHSGERIELFTRSTVVGQNSLTNVFKSYEIFTIYDGRKLIISKLPSFDGWKEEKVDSSNYLYSIVISDQIISDNAMLD